MSAIGKPVTPDVVIDGHTYRIHHHYVPEVSCQVGLVRINAGETEPQWVSPELHWKPWLWRDGKIKHEVTPQEEGEYQTQTLDEFCYMVIGRVNDHFEDIDPRDAPNPDHDLLAAMPGWFDRVEVIDNRYAVRSP